MPRDRKRKLKIAIFTDSYLPEINGVTTSIERFSKLLAEDGHQIAIFCPKYGFYLDKRQPNISIKRYASFRFPTNKEVKISLPLVTRVIQDLRKFSPDIVHIQTPITVGWISLWATKILKLKNIQTYHTYIPDFLVYLKPKTFLGLHRLISYLNSSKFLKPLPNTDLSDKESQNRLRKYLSLKIEEASKKVARDKNSKATERFGWELTRTVYNRAELVLSPTDVIKELLEANGVKSPIEVLSNGIEYQYFKKKRDYNTRERLVYVGRLGYEKHVDVVIRAFQLAQKKKPNLVLDIIGDGPARKSLEGLVSTMKIDKSVKFKGFRKRSELAEGYSTYDAFITASTIETQSLVLLEAMAAGLPVIGVDKLAIPEIVLDGENGFLSRPFREKEMSANIVKFYNLKKEEIEKLGKKSLSIAKSHDINICKEKLVDIYYRVIDSA